MALALRRLGYAVSAVDVSLYACHPRLAARAGSGLTIHAIESLASLPFPNASMDGVVFLEILEHLTINPKPMWGELGRILRPGGPLFLTTPNFYRLGGAVVASCRRSGSCAGMAPECQSPTSWRSKRGHHWKEYSLQELRQYFAFLGWRITAADRFNYLPTQRVGSGS